MIRDTRCELRGVSISITKFTELWWNDGVFEGSEEHWKLWRCEVEIFCFLKRFFTLLRFVQNDRVLFCSHGLKIRAIGMRYELRDASISITKFTEIGWNDCVFERTEEHQRCSGCVVKLWSRKVVKLWRCEDVILKYFTEEILHFVVLRSEWQGYIFYSWLEICFNGRIVFESQRFFFELLF